MASERQKVRPTPTIARLVEHVAGDDAGVPVADELSEWLSDSRRFRAFVEEHRDKVRKKLRGATDVEAHMDVRAELLVAYRLLVDRRIGLSWEPYGSTSGGPDFRVTHRGSAIFNLEVTRLRGAGVAAHGGPMLSKLHQLPPGVANVLLVALGAGAGDPFDPAAVARSLRARADAKDEEFFTRRALQGTRAFYERFLRLGAVIVWTEAGAARPWVNPSARIAVPVAGLRAVVSALDAPHERAGTTTG